MGPLRCDWDPAKADANKRKHGVSFLEAQSVFYDEQALFMEDPDHSQREDRFVLVGLSARLRILVVVHAYRENPDTIRIISARKATAAERGRYDERRRL